MALTLSIIDTDLKEAAGILNLGSLTWPGETDHSAIIAEAIEKLETDLTEMGLDPDDIAGDDTSLKPAATWKALEILFFGFMVEPGDAWETRAEKAERLYRSKLRKATITLSDTSTVTVGPGRARR